MKKLFLSFSLLAVACGGVDPDLEADAEAEAPAYSLVDARYTALWHETGGGPWVARHGLTSAAYQYWFNYYTRRGYRLTDVSGYTVGGQDRYAAIWEQKSGPAWVARHRMSAATYQAEFNTWTARGYRLTDVSGYTIGGQDRYAAIWTRSTGPAWVARHGMSSSTYQSEFNRLARLGYKVVHVAGHDSQGQAKYAAIWHRIRSTRIARHGMTSAAYQAAFNQFAGWGYLPVQVSAYNVAGADRYAAIWARKPSFGVVARHGMNPTQYQAEFNRLGALGYRLVGISGAAPVGAPPFPSFSKSAEYPFDMGRSWTNDLQGVTHDASNWYMTNTEHIFKIPVNRAIGGSNPISIYRGMPSQLSGYEHLGDMQYYNGLIYVAVENSSGAPRPHVIAVFDTGLNYVAHAPIPGAGGAPWAAVDPRNGLLYTSDFNTNVIREFRVIWLGSTNPNASAAFELELVREIRLRTSSGALTSMSRVQGGVVSDNGHLYVVQDKAGGGIYGVDLQNGRIMKKIAVNFDPGETPPEELEGITIWDLDNGSAPGINGQIHLQMIDNDWPSNDDLYFKHFRANPKSNL